MRRWYVRIATYANSQIRPMLAVLLLILSGAALEALQPWPLKVLLDSVLATQPIPSGIAWMTALPGAAGATGKIAYLTCATVLLFLLASAVRMVQSYIQEGASARMVYHLSADLFEHLQRLSLKFHTRAKTGDLLQRVINDTGCVRELIVNVTLPFLTSLAQLTAMFVIMWRMDPVLTCIALAVGPPLLLTIRLLASPLEERTCEQSELEGMMMGAAEETLAAIPIVQAFSREAHEDKRFGELTARTGLGYLRVQVFELGFRVATTSITALGSAAILWFGGLHALEHRISLGTLLVFISYLAALYAPVETLAYLAYGWASAAAGARRVLQVMQIQEEIVDRSGSIDLPVARTVAPPCIALDHVNFGYEAGHAVLRDISLQIESGQTVALVGATGSGKSTLLSLLVRLFDPWSGRVTLDGRELREIRLASLRSQIAVVLQEPYLFPLSIVDNIAYGCPGATRTKIIEAAIAAQAEDFIRRLPQGFDTVIGERGVTLSGGERQRIAIARAFLKDAPVLLMDEPTAAMDARTEANLLDAMDHLMSGRTSVIVAHRLSTIRNVSRIFVLEDGRLVESGSEADLLARKGVYSQFHSLQSGATATV
jgi:ATP-binding cassette subfamily B protein/subfamily B ATP-binding cassette protein MsbA